MSRQDIEYLLDRYLNGLASDQEKQQVETWLNQHGEPNAEWQQLSDQERAQWLASLYSDIQNRIGKVKKVVPITRVRLLWRSVAAVAAILALFFSAYLAWPLTQQPAQPIALTALKTPGKQQRQITLADGSRLWVNVGSELRYPKVFNGKIREVYLSGEAYFDIRHDASKPFIIHTGNVITTVLGTAFNIKEDKTLHTVVVTVTRGKVSVANGNKPLGILTPNQQLSFDIDAETIIQKQVDAAKYVAWQQGDLHFDDISFADAAQMLEQRFHVKIGFSNDKVKKCRFTGTSLTGDDLDKILNVICAFNGATYKTAADGNITIDGPGCDQ